MKLNMNFRFINAIPLFKRHTYTLFVVFHEIKLCLEMGSVFHSQLYSICETAVTQEALGTDIWV